MNIEIWKTCEISPSHEVSNIGRVRQSPNRASGRGRCPGKLISPQKNHNGYLAVVLLVDGRQVQRRVHQLVAAAFIGPCPQGKQVNHIDGNKQNNAVGNLEYVTISENAVHAFRNGLRGTGEDHPMANMTDERAREVLAAKGTMKMRDAAIHFGCGYGTVGRIWNRQGRFASLVGGIS